MYIRKTTRKYKDKVYVNYVLVESVRTPKGPRQRTICTLGDLAPRSREEWLKLAHKVEEALVGQGNLFEDENDEEIREIVRKVRARRAARKAGEQVGGGKATPGDGEGSDQRIVAVDTDGVEMTEQRVAGPLHVGLGFWRRLELDRILEQAGLDKRSRTLTCAMVMNRLIHPSSEHAMPGWIRRTALADLLGEDFSDLLDVMAKRAGLRPGNTVVVDRGMAYKQNLEQIRRRGLHYIVATPQSERSGWVEEFCEEEGFEEVVRTPSPTNPAQKKSLVWVRKERKDGDTYVLCVSSGREAKDRAIREKKEAKFLEDLEKLSDRVAKGRLVNPQRIAERVGRLKQRHGRVAPYYRIEYDPETKRLRYEVDEERRERAASLDGCYLLRTDRDDLTADEIWRIYMLLTRAEHAFRDMKSPLGERPIFHQLEHRVETHIFLCVLAFHILMAIEKTLRDQGDHRSWGTIRETLSTHQAATIILPTSRGDVLCIRKCGLPDPEVREIYKRLDLPPRVMRPVRTWILAGESE